MLKNNRNLVIVALIAVVNALGYGIIIPILYSYSQKFGLSDFQNGLLFAIFSVCQFISTPIIGRMSDKYGRKPLLAGAMLGTTVSFFITAFAPNGWFLFLARALDGITAGNIPVALAVISDTTAPKDRARGFGIIGAAFGFGFIFGPAIAAFTVQISDSLPFIIAGLLALTAGLATIFFLPETNKHIGDVKHDKLFDFAKLFHALKDEAIGLTLVISLLYSVALSIFIFAFQPFSVKKLGLSPNQISIIFTMLGLIGVITQVVILPFLSKRLGVKRFFTIGLFFVAVSFMGMFLSREFYPFILAVIVLGFSNSSINPLIQTIVSQETDAKSQGTIQGLNASYMSIGQIIGPILGGALATISIVYPFLAGCIFTIICFALSFNILKHKHKHISF